MYCLNGAIRNVFRFSIFSSESDLKGEKNMMIFWWRQGLVFIQEFIELQRIRGMQSKSSAMTRRDFPSVLVFGKTILWVQETHRNVFLATRRPRSRARDRGGERDVPDAFRTKRLRIRKVLKTPQNSLSNAFSTRRFRIQEGMLKLLRSLRSMASFA